MTYTEALETALLSIINRIERVKMKDFETSVLAFNVIEDAQKALKLKPQPVSMAEMTNQGL